jgi:uncharacterized protein
MPEPAESAEIAAVEFAAHHPVGLVALRTVPGKGRGVVAVRNCARGTELERAPVVIVPDADILQREAPRTVIDQYLLYWSDEDDKEHALGGGLLMFYNHSTRPNVELHDGPEPETMSVFALRDIRAGEELVYDYGIDLWFDAVD